MYKLISTEIIIGELVEEKDNVKAFKNLLVVFIIENRKDQPVKFNFMSYHPFCVLNETIKIKNEHIVTEIEKIPPAIIESYKKVTNPSPIVIPQKSSVITPK